MRFFRQKSILTCLLLTAFFSTSEAVRAEKEFIWNFDEGTGKILRSVDGEGSGMAEGISRIAGFSGNALEFDGERSRAVLDIPFQCLNEFSLSCWIKPYGRTDGVILEIPGSLTLSFNKTAVTATAGNVRLNSGGTVISGLDVWTHVAFVYDGNSLKLLVNGVPMAETAKKGLKIEAEKIAVGSRFYGGIDEVAVADYPVNFENILEDCFSQKVKTAEQFIPESLKKSGDYFAWITGPTEMVARSDVPLSPAETAKIELAGNETKGLQLVIKPLRLLKDVEVSISRLKDGRNNEFPASGVSLYRVAYVYNPPELFGTGARRQLGGFYPDALPPLDKLLTLYPEKGNQPVFINFSAPPGIRAGIYRGEITVKSADAKPCSIPLEVAVLDFSLPEENHLRGKFNIGQKRGTGYDSLYGRYWGSLQKFYDVTTPEEVEKVYEKYYSMLLEHRLIPAEIPVDDTLSAEADKYLSDPRLNSFLCFGYTGGLKPRGLKTSPEKIEYMDRELLEKTVRHLKKKGWWDKSYFYPIDEPGPQSASQIMKARELYRAISEDFKIMTPCNYHREFEGLVDIWTFHCFKFNPLTAKRLQARGNEIWLYLADSCGGRYPNYYLSFPRAETRAAGWLYRLYDIQGYEYYQVNLWYKNPWKKAMPSNNEDDNFQGVLVYPGKGGPVSSLRLEAIKDGLQDYEYLWLLEQRLLSMKKELNPEINPDEIVKNCCRAVTPAMNLVPHSPDVIYKMRKRVAEEILLLGSGIWLDVPVERIFLQPDEKELSVKGRGRPGTELLVDGSHVKADEKGEFNFTWRIPEDQETVEMHINKELILTFWRDTPVICNDLGHEEMKSVSGGERYYEFFLDPLKLADRFSVLEPVNYVFPNIPMAGTGKKGKSAVDFRVSAPYPVSGGEISFSSLQAVKENRFINLYIKTPGGWTLIYNGKTGFNDGRLYDVTIPGRVLSPYIKNKKTLEFRLEFVNGAREDVFTGFASHSSRPFFRAFLVAPKEAGRI